MIVWFLVGAVAGPVQVALVLVVSQSPKPKPPAAGQGLDFSQDPVDYSDLRRLRDFTARDGAVLQYRQYECRSGDAPVLVLVHGSAWHGMQFHAMAKAIAAAGLAEVIVPDMRGHGKSPQRRGDVDYIDQMQDDIADLIGLVAGARPVILGGHSSGGGFVIRFAGGKHGRLADGFILLAPFLKHNAPTTRKNAGGWAAPAVRRIIGLSILNRFGLRLLNHLPVIAFAMPQSVLDGPYGDTATLTYSYRLNVGFSPRPNYQADLASLRAPFLLLVGAKDEAFVATNFEPLMARYSDSGSYKVLKGLGHLDIVSDRRALSQVQRWLQREWPTQASK